MAKNLWNIKIRYKVAGCWWLTLLILGTQKAKIRRPALSSQRRANSS
jgi:hypothetical protein